MGQLVVHLGVNLVEVVVRLVHRHHEDVTVPVEPQVLELGHVVLSVAHGRGSRGSPSNRSPMMLRCTSLVPPPIVRAREK